MAGSRESRAGAAAGMRRRVAIGFLGGPYTVQAMTETVRLAEQRGFESAWASNDIGGRDPYVALASWAMATERLRLGVAASNPYTRHPVELAQTIATLDEASLGRAILGLGTGASWRSLIADRWDKPIGALKEAMQVLRELWARPDTTYRGVPVSIRDSDWVWPTETTSVFRQQIPIYLGASGPQMTRLAARAADGLLIALFKFRSSLQAQARLFRETAAQAGRDPTQLDIAPLIGVWVAGAGDDLQVMRRTIAFEISRLSETVAAEKQIDLEAFRQIKAIYARHAGAGGIVKYGREPAAYEAAPYVSLSMLKAFAIVGSLEECVEQVEPYLAAGATLPILTPLGCDARLVVEVGRRFLEAH